MHILSKWYLPRNSHTDISDPCAYLPTLPAEAYVGINSAETLNLLFFLFRFFFYCTLTIRPNVTG